MKPVIRKIRPEDPGYGTPTARCFPWLVFTTDRDRARAFRTWDLALRYVRNREIR